MNIERKPLIHKGVVNMHDLAIVRAYAGNKQLRPGHVENSRAARVACGVVCKYLSTQYR